MGRSLVGTASTDLSYDGGLAVPSYDGGGWDDDDRAALLALLRTRPGGRGPDELAADVRRAGGPRALWDSWHPPSLFSQLDDPNAAGMDESSAPLAAARVEIAGWRRAGLDVHTFGDASYPARLRGVRSAPLIVFTRGKLVDERRAVAIVGTRSATVAGRAFADELATALVMVGASVVSGLSAGIDGIALRAALTANGRAVAMLANGVSVVNPPHHGKLQEDVASAGLLISTCWPDQQPDARAATARDAAVAGYSDAVIVVESGPNGGTKAQAMASVDAGRPTVLTDLVVAKNEWARRLADRSAVPVVSSAAEALTVLDVVAMDPDGPHTYSPPIAAAG